MQNDIGALEIALVESVNGGKRVVADPFVFSDSQGNTKIAEFAESNMGSEGNNGYAKIMVYGVRDVATDSGNLVYKVEDWFNVMVVDGLKYAEWESAFKGITKACCVSDKEASEEKYDIVPDMFFWDWVAENVDMRGAFATQTWGWAKSDGGMLRLDPVYAMLVQRKRKLQDFLESHVLRVDVKGEVGGVVVTSNPVFLPEKWYAKYVTAPNEFKPDGKDDVHYVLDVIEFDGSDWKASKLDVSKVEKFTVIDDSISDISTYELND